MGRALFLVLIRSETGRLQLGVVKVRSGYSQSKMSDKKAAH